MKKTKSIQVSLSAVTLALMMMACAPAENTNTIVTTTTATPAATPDTAAVVAEITRIENDWPRVIKERDGAAVRRIEADDLVIVYPDGTLGSKEQDVKDIEAGNLTYESWDIAELNVKLVDPDTAIASFRITVKNGKFKAPDGKEQNISGQYRSVDTFSRRNGQWQLVGSATVPLSPAAAAASASPKASPATTASPATRTSPAPRVSPTRRTPPTPAPETTP